MNSTTDKLLFYRIVALWAVCEGMLGGIIHGFKLPGTGLLISSASVICIALLAWHFSARGIILKATIIVCIFKMMLSPHSPPTAYIAVLFQGLMGELLFSGRKTFKLSCIVLAVLALVESAIQRILVLTIIYGTTFWKAVDQFISKLTGDKHITNYSWYIAIGYVLLHLIVGIFIGRFAAKLPSAMKYNIVFEDDDAASIQYKRKRKNKRIALLAVWLTLLLVYLQSAFKIGAPLLASSDVLQIIVRSVLIICSWYFLLSPVLSLWLRKWLKKKEYKFKEDVEAIVAMIPSTQILLAQSWKNTAEVKGFKRLSSFAKLALSKTVNR